MVIASHESHHIIPNCLTDHEFIILNSNKMKLSRVLPFGLNSRELRAHQLHKSDFFAFTHALSSHNNKRNAKATQVECIFQCGSGLQSRQHGGPEQLCGPDVFPQYDRYGNMIGHSIVHHPQPSQLEMYVPRKITEAQKANDFSLLDRFDRRGKPMLMADGLIKGYGESRGGRISSAQGFGGYGSGNQASVGVWG